MYGTGGPDFSLTGTWYVDFDGDFENACDAVFANADEFVKACGETDETDERPLPPIGKGARRVKKRGGHAGYPPPLTIREIAGVKGGSLQEARASVDRLCAAGAMVVVNPDPADDEVLVYRLCGEHGPIRPTVEEFVLRCTMIDEKRLRGEWDFVRPGDA